MVAKKAGRNKAGKVSEPPNAPSSEPEAGAGLVKPRRQIRGFFDPIGDEALTGWAVDVAAPREPLRLRVLVDNITTGMLLCNLPRDDAKAFHLPTDTTGFSFAIPERFMDGNRHVLSLLTIDGEKVVLSSRQGVAVPEVHFCLSAPFHVEGVLDGVVDGLIQGWALAVNERLQKRGGGMRILVTCLGQPVAELLADQFRADVAEALDADANCGFTFSPPPDLRHHRRTTLRFFVMPGRHELRGSPIEIGFPDEGERERISGLIERADQLFSFAYHLRRELKAALPGERYMLADYKRWAAKMAPGALTRAAKRYGDLPLRQPLVSIVCPVFKPDTTEFLLALDSVRAQTYQNWELLLVDDASKDAGLDGLLAETARGEPRVKLFAMADNAGISNATNLALQNAAGAYIAFFDQDDLLAPEALEIMVRAQAATGARLLYSDEDKVGRSGDLSEPHFKPDFNYRLLLDLNYICHLVFCDAELVKQVGRLDEGVDGAQDHDFLLRVVERLTPGEVHHVPEILYHWRKSATSTAGLGAAKPQAAAAGARAVAGHLRRRNLDADVLSRGGLTCYRINWATPAHLAAEGVSILIPFRNHIAITRTCIDAIRSLTDHVDFEIILLDNWSDEAGSQEFCAEQANLANTSVIRIAEPFNYSRINNIGAAAARHQFLLFMNNDVVVREPGWLRTMLNELLVADRVGAVGAKLLYPNGTVQHAGVVLGVGGIADHAFRGLPADAPGYVMRAMIAQEVSAVTAACMLVRKSAFDEVNGFDEEELSVAFNDVDLCVKMVAAGWQIIFTPDAVAEHRESVSRGADFDEDKVSRFMLENEVMRQRHADVLSTDPFYSPHFSREGNVYRELRPPQELE